MRPETKHYIDRGFSGMDAFTPAEDLGAGQAQLIENFLMAPGGKLVSRSGFQGQLTTALSGPIYFARDRYVMPDGSLRLVFASAGKLYRYTPGATSAVEIKKPSSVSFSFTSAANVRFAQWGKYVFLLDAGDTSGAIWRVDLSAGDVATSLSALAKPTVAPAATIIGGTALVSSLGALTWGNSPGTDTAIIATAETNFVNGTSFWTFVNASNANTLDANGLPCVELDANTGDKDYVRFASAQALPAFGSSVPGLESLKRKLAKLEFTYAATENTGSTDPEQSVRAVLSGTDSNGYMFLDAQLDETTPTVRVFPASRFRTIADFRENSGVTHLQMRLESPTAATTKGCDVNQIVLTVPDSTLAVSNASGVATVKQGTALVHNNTLYAGGLSAWATLAATQDWSAYSSITADIRKDATVSSLSLELGAKTSAGWFWTSASSVTGQEQVVFDLSGIRSSLGAVTHIAFRVVSDLTVENLAVGGTQTLFTVANLRTPGNLSVGIPYSYLYSDFDADGAAYLDGGLESSGSPDSPLITPTAASRRASVVIPAGFSPAGDNFLIWRRGGVLPNSDTRPRLAAMVPIGSNATGGGWSWDYATRTFTDNIPDTDLWFSDAYQIGRDAPPLGGRCLIVHASRLFVGVYNSTTKVNNIYASWLLDGGTDAGYYFTNAPDPSDLEGEIKGGLLLERGDAGDRIQALASMIPPESQQNDPLAAHLLVLKETSPPSILTGSRGGVGVDGAFRLLPATTEKGAGCIAPQSAEFVHGVWWATSSGLSTLGGSRVTPVSLALGRLLTLLDIGQTRYSQIFTLWHARKAFVLLPGAGSDDGVAYVWDEQAPQGSRWTRMSAPKGFTSAVTLSGGQDTGDVYFGGRNGQIFLYTGTSDKATPSASATGIPLSLTTRKYGQGDSGPVAFFAGQLAQEIQLEMETGASLTLSGTLSSDGVTRSFSWAFPAGVSTALIRGLGRHEGTTHWIAFTASATTATALKAVSMKATETSNRGR